MPFLSCSRGQSAWSLLGEEQDLSEGTMSHGKGWPEIPVDKPTWKLEDEAPQTAEPGHCTAQHGWFISRVKCQNKPRAWGYDSRNVFAVLLFQRVLRPSFSLSLD